MLYAPIAKNLVGLFGVVAGWSYLHFYVTQSSTNSALCGNVIRDQTANKHEEWSEENLSGAPLSTRPSNTFKELLHSWKNSLFRVMHLAPLHSNPRDAFRLRQSSVLFNGSHCLRILTNSQTCMVLAKNNGRLLDSRAIFQRRLGEIVRIEDVYPVLQFGKVLTELKHRAIIRGITVD